jgi:hypothetical protein
LSIHKQRRRRGWLLHAALSTIHCMPRHGLQSADGKHLRPLERDALEQNRTSRWPFHGSNLRQWRSDV